MGIARGDDEAFLMRLFTHLQEQETMRFWFGMADVSRNIKKLR